MKKRNLENKTILLWKMALASAISWELAKLIGSDHPYLAPLSVVLCLQTTIDQSIRFSFHRILGTIIGVLLIVFSVNHLEMNGWILGLLMLGGTFVAKWLRLDETVLHQVALTIILLFTFERKSHDYALDRIIDTIVGIVVAIVVHIFLFPPDFTKKAAISFEQIASQFSEILLDLSNWVQFEWGQENGKKIEYNVNHLHQELHTTKEMLQMASKSLKFNPLHKKHKTILARYETEMKKLYIGYEYILHIATILKEWEKEEPLPSFDQIAVGNHLKVLSKFYKDYQDEINKWNERDVRTTIKPSINLDSSPSHTFYKDSFYFETANLIKNL